jgi:TATA-binding protein-associated factor Taf7
MSTSRLLRFRRRRTSPTVESLSNQLGALTRERQDLRAHEASSVALEQNRVAIARAQWDLSYALIERYLPKPETAQSAA